MAALTCRRTTVTPFGAALRHMRGGARAGACGLRRRRRGDGHATGCHRHRPPTSPRPFRRPPDRARRPRRRPRPRRPRRPRSRRAARRRGAGAVARAVHGPRAARSRRVWCACRRSSRLGSSCARPTALDYVLRFGRQHARGERTKCARSRTARRPAPGAALTGTSAAGGEPGPHRGHRRARALSGAKTWLAGQTNARLAARQATRSESVSEPLAAHRARGLPGDERPRPAGRR